MNWRKEILTELSRPGASNERAHLQYAYGKYTIWGGKYRRGGLGETEVPARAVERMLEKNELKIINHLKLNDVYSLSLKTKKILVKRNTKI